MMLCLKKCDVMRQRLSRLSPNLRLALVVLLALCPVFVLAATRAVATLDYLNSDFFTFWLGGRLEAKGGNPYLPADWVGAHHRFGATWIPNPIFPYPLPLAMMFAPLGLLPFKTAYIVWIVLSECFVAIAVTALVQAAQLPKWAPLWFPLMASAYLFRPTLVTLRNGQLGAFLLLVVTGAALLWNCQRWAPGGAVLALLLLKPTIGLPLVFLAMGWLLFRRRYRALLATLTVGLGLVVVGWLQDPGWITGFLANGHRKLFDTFGYSPTVWGAAGAICSHRFGCTLWLGSGLALLVAATGTFLLWRVPALTPLDAFDLAIPVVLAVTPYLWAYDQVLLLLPVVWLSTGVMGRGQPYLRAALAPLGFAVFSLALLFLAGVLGHDGWSVLAPLACLAGGISKIAYLTTEGKMVVRR